MFNKINTGSIFFLTLILAAFSLTYVGGFIFNYSGYGDSTWIFNRSNTPPLLLLFVIGQYIITCSLLSKTRSHILANVICSSILFVAYIGLRIQPLGDHLHWARQAGTNILWMSELLSNLIYNLVYNRGISIQYIAPIFGWATCLVYLHIGKEIISETNSSYFTFLYRLSFLSTGTSILFYFNYIENTILSIPFSLLYLYFSIKFLKDNSKRLNLVAASLALSIACLFHGQNTFFIPSLYIFIIIEGLRNSDYKNILRNMALSTIVIIATILTAITITTMAGYQVLPGNINGGGDSAHFVPFFGADATRYTRFLMFSIGHLAEISNIVVHSSPAVLIFSIMFTYRVAARKHDYFTSIRDEPVLVVTGVLTLCYLLFVILWNFDLGFPVDLDLMISLGFPLSIFIFSMLQKFHGYNKAYLTAGVLLGIYFNTLFVSSFLNSRL